MANEMRLIDANALIKEHCKNCDWLKHGSCPHPQDNVAMCYAVNLANEAPTIDAVEVVRCKDCKYYEIHKPKVLENCERRSYMIPMMPDDFCSYGERSTDYDE